MSVIIGIAIVIFIVCLIVVVVEENQGKTSEEKGSTKTKAETQLINRL